MARLSLMLELGNGVDKDPVDVIKYHKMATNKDEYDGYYNYAIMLNFGSGIEENKEEAIDISVNLVIMVTKVMIACLDMATFYIKKLVLLKIKKNYVDFLDKLRFKMPKLNALLWFNAE